MPRVLRDSPGPRYVPSRTVVHKRALSLSLRLVGWLVACLPFPTSAELAPAGSRTRCGGLVVLTRFSARACCGRAPLSGTNVLQRCHRRLRPSLPAGTLCHDDWLSQCFLHHRRQRVGACTAVVAVHRQRLSQLCSRIVGSSLLRLRMVPGRTPVLRGARTCFAWLLVAALAGAKMTFCHLDDSPLA